MKRALRIFAKVIGGLVLIVVLAVIGIHTPWMKSFIRGKLEDKLGAAVNGSASVGSVDYGFLFSHVEIGKIVIKDRAGSQVIAVDQIAVVPDRGSLLHGAPVIDDLEVSGVTATIVQGAGGTSNLDGLFIPPAGPPPPPIRIAKLHVTAGASVTLPDHTVLDVHDLVVGGSVTARPAEQFVDAAIGPVTAAIAVTRPGEPPKPVALSLQSVAVTRAGTTIDATIDKLVAGALSADQLKAHVALVDGKPSGAQSVALTHAKIDHAALVALVGKQVLLNDVALEATIAGPPDKVTINVAATTGTSKLAVTGWIDASRPPPDLRYDVTVTADGKSTDLIATPPGGVPVETTLKLAIVGAGVTPDASATVALDIGPTHAGAFTLGAISAHGSAQGRDFRLDRFSASGLGFVINGDADLSPTRQLAAKLSISGKPAEALAQLRAAGVELPPDIAAKIPPKLPIDQIALTLSAAGSIDGGPLELKLEPTKLALAGGTVSLGGTATVAGKVLQRAHAEVALAGLDFGQLGQLAKLANPAAKPVPVKGSLSGTIGVDVEGTRQAASFNLAVALRDPALAVHVTGTADAATATVHAQLGSLGTLTAQLAHDDQGLVPTRPWHLVLDLPKQSLAALGALAPPPRPTLPPGQIAVHADLGGTPASPRGELAVVLDTDAGQHGELHAQLAPGGRGTIVTTTGALTIPELTGPLAQLTGTIALPALFVGRKPNVAGIRAGAVVAEKLEIPTRELSSIPKAPPLGGSVGGMIAISGGLADPERTLAIDGKLGWHGFPTAVGGTGDVAIAVAGNGAALTANVTDGPIAIAATVKRAGDHIDVTAHATGDTPLLPLLPASVGPQLEAIKTAGGEPELGTLHLDMSGTVALLKTATGIAVERADISGPLAIHGAAFKLPHADRRWHDITLEAIGDPHGVRLTKLQLHESDLQNPDRTLTATGLFELDSKLKPQHAELELDMADWLMMIGPAPGDPLLSDAPTAALDLSTTVQVDLTAPTLAIDATLHSVTLKSPDRLERSHQPELSQVSADMLYSPPGKLPTPPPPAPPPSLPPISVRVHIPDPIHVVKEPFDVTAKGELTVTTGPTGVATRGVVTALSGVMSLFGADHALVGGTFSFTDEHPLGWFSLTFARELPAEAMRDLSRPHQASAIHLEGGPPKPGVTFDGAANSTVFQLISMYNTAHAVFIARPDMPASSTVQNPRGDQFLIMAYVSIALPDLMFLDRIAAWADAGEPRGIYGRIRNLEADRYNAHRTTRWRALARPQTPGRSTAELQLDHLWLDTDRALFGAGLRAGDRLGGGVGLFFDWTSAH